MDAAGRKREVIPSRGAIAVQEDVGQGVEIERRELRRRALEHGPGAVGADPRGGIEGLLRLEHRGGNCRNGIQGGIRLGQRHKS